MAGVDTVVNRGYVDTNRLYVFGCSGGGVLTAWTVGHTDRFAGAVSMCPVIDWISFVGTTDGSNWYYNFAKYPWQDPSEHLKRSPLMYVGNVKTPTMLMTGVNDLRTPISQTEEFYEALKINKVPTAMIRFNNEWHGTSSTPSNFIRTQLSLRRWFETNTPPPALTTALQQELKPCATCGFVDGGAMSDIAPPIGWCACVVWRSAWLSCNSPTSWLSGPPPVCRHISCDCCSAYSAVQSPHRAAVRGSGRSLVQRSPFLPSRCTPRLFRHWLADSCAPMCPGLPTRSWCSPAA